MRQSCFEIFPVEAELGHQFSLLSYRQVRRVNRWFLGDSPL
jgi:hypothetical protein